jgi:cystathionine gamma-synthase
VKKVYYPGLSDSPYHVLASDQMSGYGGMVTFEINGSMQQASRFTESLQIFSLSPSLGGVESLATQFVTTSHHGMADGERAARGISETMIRLSVGIEEERDLIDNLDQALTMAY